MRLVFWLIILFLGLNGFFIHVNSAPPARTNPKSGLGSRALSGPLALVPTEVIRTIRKTLGNGQFLSVEKTTEHGQVLYEVEVHKDGRDRVFYVDERGTLASYEVFANELPEVVRKEMQRHLKGERAEYIGRVKDENGTTYEVETRPDGKKKSYTFDDKGVWYAIMIRPMDVPPEVRKGFRKVEPEAKLVQVEKVIENNRIYYEFEVVKMGKSDTLWIDSKGKRMDDEDATK